MALPCYMQDDHPAAFECREYYPFLKLAKSPPNHSFWNLIEKESNVVPDACRSFQTTLPRSSYPNESGTPTSTPVVNVCPGARCSTTTAHRASFVVIRTLTLLKLSPISNCRTVVTLVGVCVCVCAYIWNKRDVCAFEMHFHFFRILHTNACTNTSFRAVSLVKLHTIFRISIPLLRYRQ